jgi:hypothetical protein
VDVVYIARFDLQREIYSKAMPDLPDDLPPPPQPPLNYDCCGSGCADCELRIYQRELLRWKKMAAARQNAGDSAVIQPRQ